MMKKIKDIIVIPVSLIFGFCMTLAGLYLGVAVFGVISIMLIFESIENPTVFVIVCDVLTFVLLFFLLTRKKFWSGLREIWNQILRNI